MRIAFITPSFFGYETSIADALRDAGADVIRFDERPTNTPLGRAVARVAPKLLGRRLDAHFRGMLDALHDEHLDGLLVIKGETVPAWFLDEFRRDHPAAVLVYYTFDALRGAPRAVSLFPQFDRLYSFDPQDVRSDPRLHYKPLFSAPEYHPGSAPRVFDVSFVGTLHGPRYRFTQLVAGAVPVERRRLFYYAPAAWFFWVRKATMREIRRVPRSAVSTRSLSRAEVVRIVQASRAVIDVQRPGQTGMTMRTFEVLATGAGLITTNRSILDEPFYDPARILVLPESAGDEQHGRIQDFIAGLPADAAPPADFDRYALSAWVEAFIADFEHGRKATS